MALVRGQGGRRAGQAQAKAKAKAKGGAAQEKKKARRAAALPQMRKAKTAKGRRALDRRAPKLEERVKPCLMLHGHKTSQVVKDVLTDLATVKHGDRECKKLTRKNPDCRPFEPGQRETLEFLVQKNECGSFVMGSHSKKRPHNLTLGRVFDGQIYDLLEAGVTAFRPIKAFSKVANKVAGEKPCLVFAGEPFEVDEKHRLLKNMVLDIFRGRVVDNINLVGLDRVIVLTAVGEGKVLFREYRVVFKKSGHKVPLVQLEEMGPRLDLALRRHQQPALDVAKQALPQRQEGAMRKRKNVGRDEFEGTVGKVYLPKQDIDSIAYKKPKGAKRRKGAAAEEEEGEGMDLG